jgi:hypothetical protein
MYVLVLVYNLYVDVLSINGLVASFADVSQLFPSSHDDQHVLSYYDVGDIVNGKVNLKTMHTHEKVNYLKSHFTPPP